MTSSLAHLTLLLAGEANENRASGFKVALKRDYESYCFVFLMRT